MSLDSKQEAETQLLKRYRKTWGQKHPAFLAGEGVSWKRLKNDIDQEAKAAKAKTKVELSPPWTSAQAAGLLGINQKVFRVLATMDSETGPLLADDGKHAAIGLPRLLEWAEGVRGAPKVRRWRESRRDEDLLGATVKRPAATFQVVKKTQIRLGLVDGKVSTLDLSHLSEEERVALAALLRGARGALQQDERGVVMFMQKEATLPEAFTLPWADEALKKDCAGRYKELLESAQGELAQLLARVEQDIRKAREAVAQEESPTAQAVQAAMLDMWRGEERDVQMLQSEVREALFDLTLPAATGQARKPCPF
ncbi:TPA: hypothetical protein ACOEBN_002213 [Stenotrophomonas maltophilia]|uniref:hypothetical protein n=1 Tax=Stenotrophomonas maltophilia TaxID=40324 RepID=UPI000DF84B1B|nr:hypothetical protein [Stenotrophomonas maltophilia]QCZ96538.1 hypothetical protein DL544_05785 [Stenotrophomonas sp. pho]MBH1562562.1 hypothetical protein [Stenotrophomonas maltophilia]MBH1595024.1 hypothetical protein [Stenotrophomonas maltophilia]MBH1644918.1 hypothetical protein [Stenotrophomonas maltophilia]MBH1699118.1 hypothetical protein [Stenotrophomonas maltophilia]